MHENFFIEISFLIRDDSLSSHHFAHNLIPQGEYDPFQKKSYGVSMLPGHTL